MGCLAVAAAHYNLFVHRDIKTSNSLVDAGGTVKLLDFGIAKLLDDDVDGATVTLGMIPLQAAEMVGRELGAMPEPAARFRRARHVVAVSAGVT